jgi:hypothetical protein
MKLRKAGNKLNRFLFKRQTHQTLCKTKPDKIKYSNVGVLLDMAKKRKVG